MSRRSLYIYLTVIALAAPFLTGSTSCQQKSKIADRPMFKLPYPDNEFAAYLQTRIDSSEFEWFTDVKSVTSSFFNDQLNGQDTVSVGDVVILGEGLFHAQAEAQALSKIYLVTLERPYKNRMNSVWQIVAVAEKAWLGK